MSSRQLDQIDYAELSERLLGTQPDQRLALTGQWELTCRCNLKCVMCYTDPFNTPERIRNELSTTEIVGILDELQEAACLELIFTGGEPLARPDFMEIYHQAYRRGFLVTVFTNGTLITETIADVWAVARPKAVEISLHGISSHVFDGVTKVGGSIKRCLDAVERLVARQIPVVLKTVGLTLNREEILAVKHYAESLGGGVTWRFGQYLRNDLLRSGAPLQFQLSEQELQVIEKQDPRLWEAKCDELAPSPSQTPTCGGGRYTFHIDAYGQLQLCSNNRRAGYDLRKGTFWEGFHELLPMFPCPRRPQQKTKSERRRCAC